MKILILDNRTEHIKFFIEQFCDHDLIITENAFAAINYLENDIFSYIFLDNYLGEGNGDGLSVANYLSKHKTNPNNYSKIFIHSWNIIAAYQMQKIIPKAIVLPFDFTEYSCLSLDK